MQGTEKRQIAPWIVIGCLLALLTACTTPIKKIQISNKFAANDKLPSLKLAILPLNGKKEGAEFFREALHATLMDTGLNISEKFVVDGIIKKNGWNTPEQLFAIPPQKLGEALGADALLYGKVTKWNKYYAIIHSTLVVGLELKLVDARTGELLWTGEQLDNKFEGLIKIPTGIISAIVSPLIFVGEKSHLNSLASKVAKEITESLRKPYEIKEEDKMDQTITIASAHEYIKKIEENNSVTDVNSIKKEFVDDGLSPLESLATNVVKTAKAEEKNQKLSEPESSRPELEETNDAVIVTEPLLVASQRLPLNETNLASLKAAESTAKSVKMSKPENNFQHKKNIYTIQVGAFKSQNYAKALIEKLKKKGYNSFIAMARIGKKMWYKVHIERFKDKSKAVLYAKKLQLKEKLSYFITRTDTAPPA